MPPYRDNCKVCAGAAALPACFSAAGRAGGVEPRPYAEQEDFNEECHSEERSDVGIRIPRVNVRRVSAAAHMGAALRKFMIRPCAEHGVRQLTADDRKGRPYGYITNSAAVNSGGRACAYTHRRAHCHRAQHKARRISGAGSHSKRGNVISAPAKYFCEQGAAS